MSQPEFGIPTVIPLVAHNLSRSATEVFSRYFSYSSILVHFSENLFPDLPLQGGVAGGKVGQECSLQPKRGSLMQWFLIHTTQAF